jgi:hypothetical protein
MAATVPQHSLLIQCGPDAVGPQYYFSGISNPAGDAQINFNGLEPGYLNHMTAGAFGSDNGFVSIFTPEQKTLGGIEIIALAIHVADNAGPSHSLATMNDPALGDIIDDLNSMPDTELGKITAYDFNNAPSQYTASIAALAQGEQNRRGEPFDILLVQPNQLFANLISKTLQWQFNFSGEVGTLDGITSLQITDIGVVPEPVGIGLVLGCACFLLRKPRRH